MFLECAADGVFFYINLLYEDENVVVHQGKYIMDGVERTPVSTTHFRDGRPWRQLVNRLAIGKIFCFINGGYYE